MQFNGFGSFLCLWMSLFFLPFSASAKNSDWYYKKFPMVKPGQKIKLPTTVQLGREQLKIRMSPTSGTHARFGVDQIYLSKNSTKKILIKQDVAISNKRILGEWIKLSKGYVYHFEDKNKVHAIFTTGYNERNLNEIEKKFRSLKQRYHSENHLKNPIFNSFVLMSYALNPPCAEAQSEIGDSAPAPGRGNPYSGVAERQANAAASQAGQDLLSCLIYKTGDELGELQYNAVVGVKNAVVSATSAIYHDGFDAYASAFWYLYEANGRLGQKIVDGVTSTVSGVYNYANSTSTNAAGQLDLRGIPDRIWSDIHTASTNISTLGQGLYNQFSEEIAGFNQLPPEVKNMLICEMGAEITAQGLVGVTISAMTAGAMMPARVAAMLTKFQSKVSAIGPTLKLYSSSKLPLKEKLAIVKAQLKGAITAAQAQMELKSIKNSVVENKETSSSEVSGLSDNTNLPSTTFNQTEELQLNGKLTDVERKAKAGNVLRQKLTPTQEKAIIEAHEVGLAEGRGYGTYTKEDITKKGLILKNAGFKADEIRVLMEKGIVGQEAQGTVRIAITDMYGRIRYETVSYVRPKGYPNTVTNQTLSDHLREIEAHRKALVENPRSPNRARLLAELLEKDELLKENPNFVTPEISRLFRTEAENLERHLGTKGISPVPRDPLEVSRAYAQYASTLPPGAERDQIIQRAASFRELYSDTKAYRDKAAALGEAGNSATVHAEHFRELRQNLATAKNSIVRDRVRAQMSVLTEFAKGKGWNMRYFTE